MSKKQALFKKIELLRKIIISEAQQVNFLGFSPNQNAISLF